MVSSATLGESDSATSPIQTQKIFLSIHDPLTDDLPFLWSCDKTWSEQVKKERHTCQVVSDLTSVDQQEAFESKKLRSGVGYRVEEI